MNVSRVITNVCKYKSQWEEDENLLSFAPVGFFSVLGRKLCRQTETKKECYTNKSNLKIERDGCREEGESARKKKSNDNVYVCRTLQVIGWRE